jgi:hypothetical protein
MRGRSIGIILLSIYLIIAGLVLLIGLSFVGLAMLQGLVALLAGIFLLLGR